MRRSPRTEAVDHLVGADQIDQEGLRGQIPIESDRVRRLDAWVTDEGGQRPAECGIRARRRRPRDICDLPPGRGDIRREPPLQTDVDDVEVLLEKLFHQFPPPRAARRVADHRAASALLDATSTPRRTAGRQRRGRGPADPGRAAYVPDERDGASFSARRGDDRHQLCRRIIGRTVSQHHIEQHDSRRRIGDLVTHAAIPLRRVDHRMRLTAGEFVVTHVDDRVFLADPDVVQRSVTGHRRVGVDCDAVRLMDQLRLVAERATGEDAANVALAWRHRVGEISEGTAHFG